MFAEMGAEPLPVAIDGRRIPTDPIRHDARLVTAANFCATGTGIHDDTDALLAYLNWFRRQLSEPNPQRVWKLSDRSRYRVTKSLNFSGFTNVEFDGGRSQIYSSERDFPIIDALGTSDTTFQNLFVHSFPDSCLATVGLQIGGRSQDGVHASNLMLRNVVVTGNFSRAPLVNSGLANLKATNVQLSNMHQGENWSYALIQDGIGFWPVTSKYTVPTASNVEGLGVQNSEFLNSNLENWGRGAAVWMGGVHEHRYFGGRVRVSNHFTTVVLNFKQNRVATHGNTQSQIEWNIPAHASPTSAIFLFTGSSTPTLDGVTVNDNSFHATTVFSAEKDVEHVTVLNANITLPFPSFGADDDAFLFDTPTKFQLTRR